MKKFLVFCWGFFIFFLLFGYYITAVSLSSKRVAALLVDRSISVQTSYKVSHGASVVQFVEMVLGVLEVVDTVQC